MKLIASGVAFSAATKRSPSFSRSALSTRITIRPLRTSGSIRSTVNSLVRCALMRYSPAVLGVRPARDEPQELGAGLLAVEFAGERRGRRDRVLLLYAAHLHAQVLRLHHHRHAERLQRVLDAVAHI